MTEGVVYGLSRRAHPKISGWVCLWIIVFIPCCVTMDPILEALSLPHTYEREEGMVPALANSCVGNNQRPSTPGLYCRGVLQKEVGS